MDDDGGGAPGNSPFTGLYTWIWQLPQSVASANIESGGTVTDTSTLLDFIKSKGFKGVLIKAGQGNHLYPASDPFSSSLVNLCHQKGLKIYGWHYIYGGTYDAAWMEYTSVTEEANIAKQILATGCDGLILDWETEFRDVGGDLGATPAANALQFGQEVRQSYPNAFMSHAPIWNPNRFFAIFSGSSVII